MMHRYNNYLTDDDIFLNSPDVYDGKLTIKDSSNTVLGLFSANCPNDVEVVIPSPPPQKNIVAGNGINIVENTDEYIISADNQQIYSYISNIQSEVSQVQSDVSQIQSDINGLMPLINPVIAAGNIPAINPDGSLYDSGISLTQIMDAIAAGDAILQAQIDALYAMLNITYTVTFDSNGGSTVADQSVARGGKASDPGGVTKSGYTLDGWYTDNGTFTNKWDFANNIVTTDITLYAKWNANVTTSLVFQFYTDQTCTTPASGSVTPKMTNTSSTLEYSLDREVTWTAWTSGAISSNGTEPICFKGTGSGLFQTGTASNSWVLNTWCKVTGDINALLTTNMSYNAFSGMFYNCTSLITAPALPATTLADSCYYNMFRGCTNLTTAPALPATTLTDSCYAYMFYGCTSLTQISVRFTAWNGNSTSNWFINVAGSGAFYCPSALPDNRGASYIPTGWTKTDI